MTRIFKKPTNLHSRKSNCMFVSSNNRREVYNYILFNDKELPMGNTLERLVFLISRLLDNPKGSSAYKFIFDMSNENNLNMQNNSTHILTSAQTTQGEFYKERFFKTITDFYQFHEPSTLIDTNSELLMCFFKIAEAEEPLPHFVQNTVWNATQQNIFLVKLHETLRDYLTSIKSEIKI